MHGINVNKAVILDITMLHLNGHLLPSFFQGGPVHLRQTGRPQGLLLKVLEDLVRIPIQILPDDSVDIL